MKLITLNTWGGRVVEPLAKFIQSHRETDIFCFQEVFSGENEINPAIMKGDLYGFERIQNLLPSHKGIWTKILKKCSGLAMFFGEHVALKDFGEIKIYDHDDFIDWSKAIDHTRKAAWALLTVNGKELLIITLHGHWVKDDKTDNPARIEQSNLILGLLNRFSCPRIVCGDFNLRPDTESVRILERAGLRNLITEYGITNTRSALYTRKEKFADYIFTSPEIKVKNFQVLPDSVSDHAPLALDFEIQN